MADLRKVFGFDALQPYEMYSLTVPGEPRARTYSNENSLKAAIEELRRTRPGLELKVRKIPRP